MEKAYQEIKLARGVLMRDGNVLLVQDIRPGQGHYFLPGGNVELGESIRSALPREWQEELGWEVRPADFLGCLEHKWSFIRKADETLVEVVEVNFLFTVNVSEQELQQHPTSKEAHLKFSWMPVSELRSIKLLPVPLKDLLPQLTGARPSSIWISTLD